jgi:hypothetical protein
MAEVLGGTSVVRMSDQVDPIRKTSVAIVTVCLMFFASFVLVGASYRALPPELPVLRVFLGHSVLWAQKTPFMVFIVHLMNLIHGVMAAVMFSRAPAFKDAERRRAYSNLFFTLMLTIAFKADFEASEFFVSSSRVLMPYSGWFALGALISVIVGLSVALIWSRGVRLPWPELRLTIRDWVILAGLFAIYLAIVIASLVQGHRV